MGWAKYDEDVQDAFEERCGIRYSQRTYSDVIKQRSIDDNYRRKLASQEYANRVSSPAYIVHALG